MGMARRRTRRLGGMMVLLGATVAGCTAARPGLAAVAPSYSYLRDHPAHPFPVGLSTNVSAVASATGRNFANADNLDPFQTLAPEQTVGAN